MKSDELVVDTTTPLDNKTKCGRTSRESVGQDEWVNVVSDAATPRDKMKLQKLEQCNLL